MKIVEIEGCNAILAKDQPEYLPLPIRREVIDGVPYMLSAWKPDAEEMAKIMMGAPIVLSIMGSAMPFTHQHPPVMISVGEVPASAATMDVDGGTGPSQLLFNWRVKSKDHPATMGQFIRAANKVSAIEQVAKLSGLAPDLLFAVADDA